MSPEKKRQFDRLLRRERVRRTLDTAVPVGIGAGLLIGIIWLRDHGGPAWIGLALAIVAALAKPALIVLRVLEKRRNRNQLD